MGWSIGEHDGRDIGYGVPALCDAPGCSERINRGLGYVCCDQEPYGGEKGCGLFFCGKHADLRGRCSRCRNRRATPYKAKPDLPEWIEWKLTHESWQAWRDENPAEVMRLRAGSNSGPAQ